MAKRVRTAGDSLCSSVTVKQLLETGVESVIASAGNNIDTIHALHDFASDLEVRTRGKKKIVKRQAKQCSTCEKPAVNYCDCCDDAFCESCAGKCMQCDKELFCTDCITKCIVCDEEFCKDCVTLCDFSAMNDTLCQITDDTKKPIVKSQTVIEQCSQASESDGEEEVRKAVHQMGCGRAVCHSCTVSTDDIRDKWRAAKTMFGGCQSCYETHVEPLITASTEIPTIDDDPQLDAEGGFDGPMILEGDEISTTEPLDGSGGLERGPFEPSAIDGDEDDLDIDIEIPY